MKILIGMILWIPVIALKVVAILLGLMVVPLGIRFDWPRLLWLWWDRHPTPEWWLLRARREGGFVKRYPEFWWRAIRNPVGGFGYLVKRPWLHSQIGDLKEATLTDERFQWRIRHSGLLVSLRMLWRYNDDRYGETYIGWKLGSAPPEMDFALSLRVWAKVGE